MNKIYYQSKSLTIIGKGTHGVQPFAGGENIAKMTDIEYFGYKAKRAANRRFLHNSMEVWAYTPQNRAFECIKNRSGTSTILKAFLAGKDINIRCDAAELNTARPTRFRFEDEKDHFLFQLKF